MEESRYTGMRIKPEHRKKIGERIRTILDKKGWKQQQLADASGFTKSYISLIISGSMNITLETIETLEKALNEPIIEVLK